METTMYSRSLLSRSSTRSSILSFSQAELRLLAYGQQDRMLIVLRTNAVDHPLGLQHVLLAEHFVGFLVSGIRARASRRRSCSESFSAMPH